jgi:hypothetical protein
MPTPRFNIKTLMLAVLASALALGLAAAIRDMTRVRTVTTTITVTETPAGLATGRPQSVARPDAPRPGPEATP